MHAVSSIRSTQDQEYPSQTVARTGSAQDVALHWKAKLNASGKVEKHASLFICEVKESHESSGITTQAPINDWKIGEHLTSQQKEELISLLNSNRKVFATCAEELGEMKGIEHEIKLTSNVPINDRRHTANPAKRELEKQEAQKLLDTGVARWSKSPYSAPVVLVKKKDGSIRFCVDYRRLNAITIKDAFPMPDVTSTTHLLGENRWWSKLDAYSGYWQVKVKEEDIPKTAFSCALGHLEMVRMPFGLVNAGATYQRGMTQLFQGKQWQYILTYIDDIIVFSHTFEEHMQHLQEVFNCLNDAGVRLKHTKCEFCMEKINFLGHIISKEGIRPDPSKMEAITQFPVPKGVEELRRFLGMTGYHRMFVKDYAIKANALEIFCTPVTLLDGKTGQTIARTGSAQDVALHWKAKLNASGKVEKHASLFICKVKESHESSGITTQAPINNWKIGEHLTSQQKEELISLLNSNCKVFATCAEELGEMKGIEHEIKLTSNVPINDRHHTANPAKRELEKQEAQKLLDTGVARWSKSPYSAPVVLVKKKDGSICFCVDYRRLNAITIKDAFPMPDVTSTTHLLGENHWWSKLDAYSGYWQVKVKEEDIPKTAFSCALGHLEMVCMPFSLVNAGATYQRGMTQLFQGKQWQYILTYIDDIIVFSHTFEEHMQHLQEVFNCLNNAGVRLKHTKCEFCMEKINFLGHIISKEGIRPDPSKMEAIMQFPVPKGVEELRRFLGMTGYH
ncbi:Transposon Ty3-G Gag-Pol polyprotein [Pelomyxa schiedti]|nr:Transposon Ty3-G Gag-Pol polyprotein [Pelomyxa schiedti]